MRTLQSGLLFLALGTLAIPSRAAEVDGLLPNDTNGIVTINVKQLLDSALFKKIDDKFNLKEAIKKDAGAQGILDKIGLDPMKDIDRIILAASKGEDGLLLAVGKFNKAKLEAAAVDAAKDEKEGLKILKEGGYTIYEKSEKNGHTVFAAILDGTTIVASPKKEFVIEALDKKAGKKTALLKKEFTAVLSRTESKHSVSVAALPAAIESADLADKLKSIVGSVNVTDEIKINVQFAAKDEASAKDMEKTFSDQLSQVKVFANIMATQDKHWALLIDVLGTLKLDSSQSNVTLKGEIGRDVVDKLIKAIPAPPAQ